MGESKGEEASVEVSSAVQVQFTLAGFQAKLETFVDHVRLTEDKLHGSEEVVKSLKGLLKGKDGLLEKTNAADAEQYVQALSEVEKLKKEKFRLQDSLNHTQIQLNETIAKYSALQSSMDALRQEATKQRDVLSKDSTCSRSSSKVEKIMIDALAVEQKKIQRRLHNLEQQQSTLVETAKKAQENHLATSEQYKLLQNEAQRSLQLLAKTMKSLTEERHRSRGLAAQLHVLQFQVQTGNSHVKYLQEKLNGSSTETPKASKQSTAQPYADNI